MHPENTCPRTGVRTSHSWLVVRSKAVQGLSIETMTTVRKRGGSSTHTVVPEQYSRLRDQEDGLKRRGLPKWRKSMFARGKYFIFGRRLVRCFCPFFVFVVILWNSPRNLQQTWVQIYWMREPSSRNLKLCNMPSDKKMLCQQSRWSQAKSWHLQTWSQRWKLSNSLFFCSWFAHLRFEHPQPALPWVNHLQTDILTR